MPKEGKSGEIRCIKGERGVCPDVAPPRLSIFLDSIPNSWSLDGVATRHEAFAKSFVCNCGKEYCPPGAVFVFNLEFIVYYLLYFYFSLN